MKKLLLILLSTMLILSLAVSAFATDGLPDFHSVWDSDTYPYAVLGLASNGNYVLAVSSVPIVSYNGKPIVYGPGQQIVYKSGSWNPPSLIEEGYNATIPHEIVWTSHNIFNCDGSSCPVTDFDLNEVCDTCGMPLAYSVQRSYVPDSWPSGYPALPVGADDSSQYILMTKDDGYTYLYMFTPYADSPVAEWNTVGTSHNSMQLKMYDSNGEYVNVKRLTYRLNDSGEWSQHDSQVVDSTLFGDFTEIDMIYSTLSFYKEDGTLFFPVPLWLEIQGVTQGEMVTTQTTVVGAMKTLVLCGVGLMALLVVLSLFGKRSLIFRR